MKLSITTFIERHAKETCNLLALLRRQKNEAEKVKQMTRNQKSCSFIEPEGSNIRGTRIKCNVFYHHRKVDKGKGKTLSR